jgi:hypothetical protein
MTPQALRDGLVAALEAGGEGYTLQDLENELASGKSRLWIGERSALVTYVEDIGGARSLHVWQGCGDLQELIQMRIGIEAYARAHACQWATIDGRSGWARVFAKAGFERHGEVLRKRL